MLETKTIVQANYMKLNEANILGPWRALKAIFPYEAPDIADPTDYIPESK